MARYVHPPKPMSIVDQAVSYQQSTDPEAQARLRSLGIHPIHNKLTIDSVRKLVEDRRDVSKFPELSSVDTSDEALTYLIEKEEFERQYPAKSTRQPVNKAAWRESMKKPSFTNVTSESIPEQTMIEVDQVEVGGDVQDEVVVVEEKAIRKEMDSVRSEFDFKLDAAQLEALEAIRARRERQRAKSSKE
jgi:hypothetical protein